MTEQNTNANAAIETHWPVDSVPFFGEFEELQVDGQRFLVAVSGLWMEARRPWLYLRQQVMWSPRIDIPYGELSPTIQLLCGKLPKEALDAFIANALQHSPRHSMAYLLWDKNTNAIKLHIAEAVEAAGKPFMHLRPSLHHSEIIVCELKCMGESEPTFTEHDNLADKGDFKLSVVMGNCNSQHMTLRARIAANGLYLPLDVEHIFAPLDP